MLRAAVFKKGSDPGAYSLHSLRDGGPTSLCQAALDVELVASFGIWATKSISAYFRGSHRILAGMSDTAVATSPTLHKATRRLRIPNGEHRTTRSVD